MLRAIEVVAELAERRVVGSYAIVGAVAAIYSIEPMLTEDLDILISVDSFEKRASGLLHWDRLSRRLRTWDMPSELSVGVSIEGWPVQFLPVASLLDEEALAQAVEIDIADPGGQAIKARCLRAEHVVAVPLKVGRLKDLVRIQAFLEQRAVDLARLKSVLERHNLMGTWQAFCLRAGIANPLTEIG